jgi:acyl dehydratase
LGTVKAGDELGPTRWLEVDQDRVDAFAGATEDSQWIHTNRRRAAEGPFGTTIAHGFLTLSLLPALWFEAAGDGDHPLTINYASIACAFRRPCPSGAVSGPRSEWRR